jgi:hypothetical protein
MKERAMYGRLSLEKIFSFLEWTEL